MILKITPTLLNNFNLQEFWLIILLCILIYTCTKTSWLLFPFMVYTSSTILFAIIFSLIILIVLFKPQKKTQLLYTLFRFGLYSNCPVKIVGDKFTNDKNTLLICNYPASFMEYIILPSILLEKNINCAIMVGYSAKKWARLFIDKENIITLDKNKNFTTLNTKIKNCLEKNIVPIIYPEKDFWNRSHENEIQPFKSGIFKIANQYNYNIMIVYIDHIQHQCGIVQNKCLEIKMKYCKSKNEIDAHNEMIMLKTKSFF